MTLDDRLPVWPNATKLPLALDPHQLRRAVGEDWEWQTFGGCRGMDVNLFYHPPGESRRAKTQRINHAKTICQTCPVVGECASWALRTREPYGIWGGLSEDERATILGLRNLRYPAQLGSRP
ncbi:MAG TPA: WhiB family transcriptional regulator [Nakamurella sp.]